MTTAPVESCPVPASAIDGPTGKAKRFAVWLTGGTAAASFGSVLTILGTGLTGWMIEAALACFALAIPLTIAHQVRLRVDSKFRNSRAITAYVPTAGVLVFIFGCILLLLSRSWLASTAFGLACLYAMWVFDKTELPQSIESAPIGPSQSPADEAAVVASTVQPVSH